jgi:integrase/recombinase XerD
MFYNAKRAEGVRDRTLADYRSYWRYFAAWLTEECKDSVKDVKGLTGPVLRAYVDYMSHGRKKYEDDPHRIKTGQKLSPVTVASRLRALQTMCKFWEEEGLLENDPAAKIKPPRRDIEEKAAFTDEHLSGLLAAADRTSFAGYRNYVLMELLADTGLRINEAVGLEEDHFDMSARCIRLPGYMNKNRKPRIVPVSTSVLRDVIRLIEDNRAYFDTNYVFISNYGEKLDPGHFRKQLKKYAAAAGIDTKAIQISPHRFRDYFCTNYLLNGGDLFSLQRIVAHADIKTTQGYVKVSEDAMRDSHTQYSPLSRLKTKRVLNKRR